MARTYGTILLNSQINQPSQVNNDVKTYFIDVEKFNKTGEIEKLGGEEVVPSIDQLAAGRMMREEIKTYDDFVACGSYQDVAKKYQVSTSTAHGLMMHLKALAAGIEPEPKPKSKAQIMREEITTLEQFNAIGTYRDVAKKYGVGKTAANDWEIKLRKEAEKMEQEAAYRVTTGKEENPLLEGQEGVLEQGKEDSSISLPKEDLPSSESVISETEIEDELGPVDLNNETIDDLQGLVEPEPAWTMPSYAEIKNDKKFNEFFDRIAEEIKKEPSDQELWNDVAETISILRERAIARANKEISDKLNKLLG